MPVVQPAIPPITEYLQYGAPSPNTEEILQRLTRDYVAPSTDARIGRISQDMLETSQRLEKLRGAPSLLERYGISTVAKGTGRKLAGEVAEKVAVRGAEVAGTRLAVGGGAFIVSQFVGVGEVIDTAMLAYGAWEIADFAYENTGLKPLAHRAAAAVAAESVSWYHEAVHAVQHELARHAPSLLPSIGQALTHTMEQTAGQAISQGMEASRLMPSPSAPPANPTKPPREPPREPKEPERMPKEESPAQRIWNSLRMSASMNVHGVETPPSSPSIATISAGGYSFAVKLCRPTTRDINSLDDFFTAYGYNKSIFSVPKIDFTQNKGDNESFYLQVGAETCCTSSVREAQIQFDLMCKAGIRFWKTDIGKTQAQVEAENANKTS